MALHMGLDALFDGMQKCEELQENPEIVNITETHVTTLAMEFSFSFRLCASSGMLNKHKGTPDEGQGPKIQ
jgi:hypothetical protein